MLQVAPVRETAVVPFRVATELDQETFTAIRRRLVLECCKWDPQVGDTPTLARFPLVIGASVWRQLATWAERLADEALEAEQELLRRPELQRRLGMPRRLRRALERADGGPATIAAGRVIRFDFHWTTEGWRISEANADVPGGFTEASSFTAMMARHYPRTWPASDPGACWADAIADSARDGDVLALLVAAGYMEDHQVVAYLAQSLRRRGIEACVCSPEQLRWSGSRARVSFAGRERSVAAIVRFYQAEWLAQLPRRAAWEMLFRGGKTPVANPASAALIESKRFPLVWDQLVTRLPTWRKLLPETRDPRKVSWRTDEQWVLKSAFCNTGDEVAIRPMPPAQWKKFERCARWTPWNWVAQRRFETVAIATPLGLARPCIGVYTVNGRAAGIYGRLAPGQLTDYAAADVAVLVADEELMR